MFDIRDVEIVREVVRCGGFRAAAQHLRLSQSVVSTRVADTEHRLGVRLFDRERHGARLTASGRRFLEQAERLLNLRDQIASSLLPLSGFAGTIRIGVAETIVHTWLPPMLSKVRQGLPDARLELSVETSPVLSRRLIDEDVDVAILVKEHAPAGAIQVPVYACDLGWFAAPAYPLPRGPLTRGELARFPILTFPKETLPFRRVERLFSDPSLPAPLLHGCASLSAMLHLVRDGFGIGLLPTQMAAGDVADGRLVRLSTTRETKVGRLEFALCHFPSQDGDRMELIREAALEAARAIRSL